MSNNSSSKSDIQEIVKFDRKFTSDINSPIDYSKLEATKATQFSSDLPNQVYKLIEIIEKINPDFTNKSKKLNILDCTGHVGSFSLCWTALFRKHKITAVEIDEFTFTRLKNNTKKLGLDEQVNVVNADVTNFINNADQYDFVYIDPPWGGPNYKFKKGLMLYLGDKSIVEFVLDIFNKKITKYVFIKVPINFDFQSLPFSYSVFTVMSKFATKVFPDYLLICIKQTEHNVKN
jgi:hypothetical protein